jgi:hypothetical protein
VVEEEFSDRELVFADGERERRPVLEVRASRNGSFSTSRSTVSRSPVMQAQNIAQTSVPMPGDHNQGFCCFRGSGWIRRATLRSEVVRVDVTGRSSAGSLSSMMRVECPRQSIYLYRRDGSAPGGRMPFSRRQAAAVE